MGVRFCCRWAAKELTLWLVGKLAQPGKTTDVPILLSEKRPPIEVDTDRCSSLLSTGRQRTHTLASEKARAAEKSHNT